MIILQAHKNITAPLMINDPETNIHINNNSTTVLKVQKPSNGSTQNIKRSSDYIDLEMITEVF